MSNTSEAPSLQDHPVVTREEWLKQRTELLAREKAFTKLEDELAGARRALPWVKIDRAYTFDSPTGKVTLADLFDGRSQLFIKHFMLGPGQATQCVGCSLEVDHLEGLLEHLQNHDVSYVSVARAPLAEIETVRRRMGWRFPWVSSYGTDFNYDFGVSFKPAEMQNGTAFYNYEHCTPWLEDVSGDSVFYKDEAGQIYHTYSAYSRGCEQFLGIYAFLDVMPKGREENGPTHSLPDWARPRNRYGMDGKMGEMGRYHYPDGTPGSGGCCCH